MDYSRRDLADRLAAEYVLGTLQGPARRRLEQLLPAHAGLRDAVAQWRLRLGPLSASVPEVVPPAAVWQRIEARLFEPSSKPATAATAAAVSWWQRLALWRGVSALATTAAVALFMVASQQPAPQAPIIVVLGANPEAAAVMNASFVASVSADGRALVLKPLGDVAVDPSRALELWAVPPQGAPRSLGLVKGGASTTLLRAELLRNTAAFAVSMEPAGGSPSGAPTGPILSVGKLQL